MILSRLLTLSSLVALAGLSACSSGRGPLPDWRRAALYHSDRPVGEQPISFVSARPSAQRQQYEQGLRESRLDQTALGSDWLAAGQRALRDSLRIPLPYRESGYFSATKVMAVGYLIDARRGDRLVIHLEVQGKPAAGIYLDLFEPGPRPTLVASTKTDPDQLNNIAELSWNVRQSRIHLLRLQPELLRSGRFTLLINRQPVLGFPVQGRDSRQINSYFGVPRDGGKRRHEGVDIEAPKGTPVLASVDGLITHTGVNALGGNGVWLTNTDLNLKLYYAHLDRWVVRTGQQVTLGDTLGYVGTTGNARPSGPHLHFGLFDLSSNPVDPLAFVLRAPAPPKQVLLPPQQLNDSVRVAVKTGFLRAAPNAEAPIRQKLPKHTPMVVVGGTTDWKRVWLPNNQTGYIAAAALEPMRQPIRRWSLPSAKPLLDAAATDAPVITTLTGGTSVEVLAQLGPFKLIRRPKGLMGWVQ